MRRYLTALFIAGALFVTGCGSSSLTNSERLWCFRDSQYTRIVRSTPRYDEYYDQFRAEARNPATNPGALGRLHEKLANDPDFVSLCKAEFGAR